jgi:hypothetical protein
MINSALLVIVPGVVLVAMIIDVVAFAGWIRSRWS